MPFRKKHLVVYIISDMSGDLAYDTVRRTLEQHPNVEWTERRFTLVNHVHRLMGVFREAAKYKEANPENVVAVAYTFAEETMRNAAREAAIEFTVPSLCLLVEPLAFFSSILGQRAVQKPGHKIGERDIKEWALRAKALEFMHEHDDGQNAHELSLADVVIVGISRVSKTPHCMYLAYKYLKKAANVVITKETEPPMELLAVAKEKVFLLKINKRRLALIRDARLEGLGEHQNHYADLGYISDEMEKAEKLAHEHGWVIVDATDKGIEETASKIMSILQKGSASIAVPT